MGLKNINFSLFFKGNLLLTSLLFTLFLLHNNNYSIINFTISFIAAISSSVILYLLLYILLFVFTFTKNFAMYLSSVIFIGVNILLVVDFFIFKLYGFHINAMVINILTSPSAMDSIQLGIAPILLLVGVMIFFIFYQVFLIKHIKNADEENKHILNKTINKLIIVPLFMIIFTEKVTYGVASLLSKNEIVSKFRVIPLYQPLTFSRIANKHFGFKIPKEAKNTISTSSLLNYPLNDIEVKKNPNKFNIFIFVSDSVKASIINKQIAPNIEKLKQDSLSFNHHYSGGNATRFGIFSLLYGLNSTYWFSFLNASKSPVFFDVLKQLNYKIDIISSTDTKWPEFRKTCYSNILDNIHDDFKGEPWEKDEKSTNKFLEILDNYKQNKPIFSFIFLDSPHGYSFPPQYNTFKSKIKDYNYLKMEKGSNGVKELLKKYKNSVFYNDMLIDKMIQKLKEKGLYDNSLIIFTSDHGQEFYEYGFFGHNSSFSKGQTQVPLIVKLPKNIKINRLEGIENNMTSHNDIVPTILTMIGVKNSSNDYSNGFNIFDKNFKRDYVFSANWNNNAIITKDKTYIFSNLPNKMFKNEIRDNDTYKKVYNSKQESHNILDVMNENRKFLK